MKNFMSPLPRVPAGIAVMTLLSGAAAGFLAGGLSPVRRGEEPLSAPLLALSIGVGLIFGASVSGTAAAMALFAGFNPSPSGLIVRTAAMALAFAGAIATGHVLELLPDSRGRGALSLFVSIVLLALAVETAHLSGWSVSRMPAGGWGLVRAVSFSTASMKFRSIRYGIDSVVRNETDDCADIYVDAPSGTEVLYMEKDPAGELVASEDQSRRCVQR